MRIKIKAVTTAIKTKIECLLEALDNEIRRQNYHS